MERQSNVAEEHRVALACHDNPKEFFGYGHTGENTLKDIYYSEPKVELKIMEIKPDKAANSNALLPKVFKTQADRVVPHLCQIFDHSRGALEI